MAPRTFRITFLLSCWIAAVSSALVGCKQKPEAPKLNLTPVTGIVTLDGKPLADADVAFYMQGNAPEGFHGSGGKTNADGKYELMTGAVKGAVPGSYKVTVSRFRDANGGPIVEQEGMDLAQLKMMGQAKETIPAKYSDAEQTELTATVEDGKPDGHDFALKGS